ncbi:AT-rich interactive domain-containing protein 5B-like isoform X3 [Dreissena polymorpha]|uniref:AT-rich interactive domain-containing protein 5B-like isoform X3 n=1 Tax=Dreissena polymorpha TaxID=45954 RepID=UPI002263D0F2|nr:AT-rich interactive domain-containing protein 5B-like isoform X3 [Dreissena polymorpha]
MGRLNGEKIIYLQKFGPACGKHGSSTFYKAFKYRKGGNNKIISIGQFFFMKILDSIPICIAELQLVWEDKHSSSELASVRLYFLPECTPDGRLPSHGEDEVLAYYEKIILKLSDLASLIVHDVSWNEGRMAVTGQDHPTEPRYRELADTFSMNSYGLDNRDIQKEQNAAEEKLPSNQDTSPGVVVMTYPRYCRYRCMVKRLENCEDKWMKHVLVCAVGGFAAANANNRVYFCRDTFEHSDLDDFELRCDHLAPNFKGRPKKRRGSSLKRDPANDSSEESSCSSSFSAQNDANSKVRTGSRATPLRNGFRIDQGKVSKDEQTFLMDLHQFMRRRNTPIGRIPSLGFKQIDLFHFYTLAMDIGGYEQISNKRMWKHLYDKLGGNSGFTSAATCTRRHYEKLLLPYERYRNGADVPYRHPDKKKKPRNEPALSAAEKLDLPAPDHKASANDRVTQGYYHTQITERASQLAYQPQNDPAAATSTLHVTSDLPRELPSPDKALIIKQEIEKMKMRKDAKKLNSNVDKHSENVSKTHQNTASKSVVQETASVAKETETKSASVNQSVPSPQVEIHKKEKITGTNDPNLMKLYAVSQQGEKRLFSGHSAQNRKPFGGQKTVRELLHQNGQEAKETNSAIKTEKEPKEPQISAGRNERPDHAHGAVRVKAENTDVRPHIPSSSANSNAKPLPAAYMPIPSQAQPVFYPQFLPMGGNMASVGLPAFMVPQFGYHTIPASMVQTHVGSQPGAVKSEKPLKALNSPVSSHSDSANKSAIPHPHPSRPSIISPPSAHSSTIHYSSSPQSTLFSPGVTSKSHNPRPILPAHSNNAKRMYPYSDANSVKSDSGVYNTTPAHDGDIKRQKLNRSQPEGVFPSNSNALDIPVLDLSMKTMKAQEARHQRGESLLFNTSFNRQPGMVAVKEKLTDSPQDLSRKMQLIPTRNLNTSSESNTSRDLNTSRELNTSRDKGERKQNNHKGIPLNVPKPVIPVKKEEPVKTEAAVSPQVGSKLFPGMVTSIGGFPIDLATFVHPAFQSQLMMGSSPGLGHFPTPLQLQQMIQGQVATAMPYLRSEFLQSPAMFQVGMTPVSSQPMFTAVPPTSVRSNTANQSSNAGKR